MDYEPPPLNVPVSWPSLPRELRNSPITDDNTTGGGGAAVKFSSTTASSGSSCNKTAAGAVDTFETGASHAQPFTLGSPSASSARHLPHRKTDVSADEAPPFLRNKETPTHSTAAAGVEEQPRTSATGKLHVHNGPIDLHGFVTNNYPRRGSITQTKDFNYNRLNSKVRRNRQIDELDRQLREEKEISRRLRSAVQILEGKLQRAEEGRRRSNSLERAFFSHLAEAEALVLQRERLMRPGTDETRAECLEAARIDAHEKLVVDLKRELEANSIWCAVPPLNQTSEEDVVVSRHGESRRIAEPGHAKTPKYTPDGDHGAICSWDSDVVVNAYRRLSGGTMRRLSSALFGQELLTVEAARADAAERERMLETRARALFEAQISLQAEKDKMEALEAGYREEVREAKIALEEAREENEQQRDMVNDAERVRSSLSRRILAMQVARDEFSEIVGERLQCIRAAVCRRVGFLPWAVEKSVNKLVELCAIAPNDSFTETSSLLSLSPSSHCSTADNVGDKDFP